MRADIPLLRTYVRSAQLPAVLLGDMVSAAIAETLRDKVRPGLRPYWIADRGRYHVDDTLREPELFASLADLASGIFELPLHPARARWVLLRRGDYALVKDDSRLSRGLPEHIEVVLDFSSTQSDDAQIVYNDQSGGTFWIPQQALGGGMIDRRRPVHRYDRYLTHRIGDGEVFRLNLVLTSSR